MKSFFFIILIFVIFETALRFIPVDYLPIHWGYKIQEKRVHCWDSELDVIRLCPHVDEILNHPLGYRFRIRTDSKGERLTGLVPEAVKANGEIPAVNKDKTLHNKNQEYIWVLGDSLSMGFGVDDEKSFAWLLNAKRGNIRNLSSDSLGSGEILKIYKRELESTKGEKKIPRYLFWIFSRSDFVDDWEKKSYWKFSLGKLSHIINILRGELEKFRLAKDRNDYKEYMRESFEDSFQPYPKDHPTFSYLGEIQKISLENNITPVILLIPDWNPAYNKIIPYTKYFLFMKEYFRNTEFVVLDGTDLYKNNQDSILWLEDDGHPNENAQKIFLEMVEEYLKNK